MRGRRPAQAKHKPVTILKDRAKFDMTPGNSGLRIRTVWSSDDGLYRCRVDFKDSPTRNSRIRLTVIGEYSYHVFVTHAPLVHLYCTGTLPIFVEKKCNCDIQG